MPIITDVYNLIFFGPIVNLLIFIMRVLEAASIPGALGFSIIILTFLVRMLVWPLMTSQLKSAKKMSELRPHLDELKKKHKDDKQALAQAQMTLYKEHGVNPAGGCLPLVIQFPIIIALYQTILALFDSQHGLERINQVLYFPAWHLQTAPNLNFFGFNLAAKPSDFAQVGMFVLLIPVITALLQLVQSMMMLPKTDLKEYPKDTPKEKKEKESIEDSMMAMQSQMVYLMPLMIGYFAFTLPTGLALYWNTFTILGIIQQYRIAGWGKLGSLMTKFFKR
jgi:YidC/Oxa1 family membrane protein insertase